LMQREVRTLRDTISAGSARATSGYAAGAAPRAMNKGEWKWDGKDWVALAT